MENEQLEKCLRERKDTTLVQRTISKLLDYQNVPIQESSSVGQAKCIPITEKDAYASLADESNMLITRRPRKIGFFALRLGIIGPKQKTMALLVPILSIVLIVVLNRFYGIPSFESHWLRPTTYGSKIQDLVEVGLVTAGTDAHGPVRLKIKGIAYSENNRSAVIGTAVIHEGDKISGATVLKIGRDSIEFGLDGEKWTQKIE